MRFARSRWGRALTWVALVTWPAALPHPANAVAACIWYPVLGLSGLIYLLSRVQDPAADRHAPAVPAAAGGHEDERDDQPVTGERTPTSAVAP
jgi:hypothetical protein